MGSEKNRSLEALDLLIDRFLKRLNNQDNSDLEIVDSYVLALKAKLFLQQPNLKEEIHKGCELLIKAIEEDRK